MYCKEVDINPRIFSRTNKTAPVINNKKSKVRVNKEIIAKEVRLIGLNGEQLGIVKIQEAIYKAEELELDLVEIAPNSAPPVCKIMNFGKYLFEQSKKQKNKAKRVQIKELKMRPVTDVGDYLVKIKRAIAFLKDGDKVKFVIRFRGREISYQNQGLEILKRVENDLVEYGVIEQAPKVEGKQLSMVVIPGKGK